jgi:hypothetical protein
MSSYPAEEQASKSTAARRTDTPPRSIFDDYPSAYQSIKSNGRTFSGVSGMSDPAKSPFLSPAMSMPVNPLAQLSDSSAHQTKPTSQAKHGKDAILKPASSPKPKRKRNFSRPISLSPSSNFATRPAGLEIRDSISVFELGSPRRLSGERSPNTKQPNLHGARGRVEKSSTIGSIVKRYGDESESNVKRSDSRDAAIRNTLEIIGGRRDSSESPVLQPRLSPAGQPPNIPLPPNPSYLAAQGLMGQTFSEPSLYENTEKLLNLTTAANIVNPVVGHSASGWSRQVGDSQHGILNTEFSWMGKSGKSSFRDLSAKEISQLRKHSHEEPEDAIDESEFVGGVDPSYEENYLLSDEVYRPPGMNQQSSILDDLVATDFHRTDVLTERALSRSDEQGAAQEAELPSGYYQMTGPGGDIDDTVGVGSLFDYGGLQSSSSREFSHESSLRNRPSRGGFVGDGDARASAFGHVNVGTDRYNALPERKTVMKSVDDDVDDDVVLEGDEIEGGEWETMGESGLRSKFVTQVSIGRSTSGSSLANVSSNASFHDDGRPPSPWDPLKSHPPIITPPTKVVIQKRSTRSPGVDDPSSTLRYQGRDVGTGLARNPTGLSTPTPALTFPTTPQHKITTRSSPTYRHPTPLSHQHRNPFSSSPPPVDVQESGGSYELNDLSRRHSKRQAIYADTHHSLLHQIHKTTPTKNQKRINNTSTNPEASSSKSLDGSYSNSYPTNLAADGSSILSPNSPHVPKSVNSYARRSFSIKRTKTLLSGSPRSMFFPNTVQY